MRLAVSIGDMNGIGAQVALKAHERLSRDVELLYVVDSMMIEQAARLLGVEVPDDFETIPVGDFFDIDAGVVSAEAGELCREGVADGVVTLPIHKKAWEHAGVHYKGHTDMLRDLFDHDAIMMLGVPGFYVALYTEHVPLKEVPRIVTQGSMVDFLMTLYHEKPEAPIGVLGLNPHAGDDGVLGDEERVIEHAIKKANTLLNRTVFEGPLVPDVAFTPRSRERYELFVALYHDQGLAPLKALYFDEAINVSLNLPIVRTSVDHGTAFDIAYKGHEVGVKSYENAVREAVLLAQRKKRLKAAQGS